jgi:hypothetical protein
MFVFHGMIYEETKCHNHSWALSFTSLLVFEFEIASIRGHHTNNGVITKMTATCNRANFFWCHLKRHDPE